MYTIQIPSHFSINKDVYNTTVEKYAKENIDTKDLLRGQSLGKHLKLKCELTDV